MDSTPIQLLCPDCESTNISTVQSTESFEYGAGDTPALLCASFPVHSCINCGFQFIDHIGMEAKDAAVEAYLKRQAGSVPPLADA